MAEDEKNAAKEIQDCAICFGPYRDKCVLNPCKHNFCNTCLYEWSKTKTTCPLCRTPFSNTFQIKYELQNVRVLITNGRNIFENRESPNRNAETANNYLVRNTTESRNTQITNYLPVRSNSRETRPRNVYNQTRERNNYRRSERREHDSTSNRETRRHRVSRRRYRNSSDSRQHSRNYRSTRVVLSRHSEFSRSSNHNSSNRPQRRHNYIPSTNISNYSRPNYSIRSPTYDPQFPINNDSDYYSPTSPAYSPNYQLNYSPTSPAYIPMSSPRNSDNLITTNYNSENTSNE